MPFMAAIPAITAGASLLGKLFSGGAKGAADQRMNENDQTQRTNSLLAQLWGMSQNATGRSLEAGSQERLAQGNQDLDQRRFALSAPSARASQSVRGSLMQNLQPASFSGLPDRVSSRIPTLQGGLNPSALNADTRALGGELSRKALLDQMAGDNFAPMQQTDFSKGVLPMPELEALKKSGLLEKILGSLGMAGNVIGGVGSLFGGGSRTSGNGLPVDPWGGG